MKDKKDGSGSWMDRLIRILCWPFSWLVLRLHGVAAAYEAAMDPLGRKKDAK